MRDHLEICDVVEGEEFQVKKKRVIGMLFLLLNL